MCLEHLLLWMEPFWLSAQMVIKDTTLIQAGGMALCLFSHLPTAYSRPLFMTQPLDLAIQVVKISAQVDWQGLLEEPLALILGRLLPEHQD